jgi:hypothetical protein
VPKVVNRSESKFAADVVFFNEAASVEDLFVTPGRTMPLSECQPKVSGLQSRLEDRPEEKGLGLNRRKRTLKHCWEQS